MKTLSSLIVFFMLLAAIIPLPCSAQDSLETAVAGLRKGLSGVSSETIDRIRQGIESVKDPRELSYWRALIAIKSGEPDRALQLLDPLIYDDETPEELLGSALLAKSEAELTLNRDQDFIRHLDQYLNEYQNHPFYEQGLRLKADYYLARLVTFDMVIKYYLDSLKKYPENRDEILHLTGFQKGYYLFGIHEAMNALDGFSPDSPDRSWTLLSKAAIQAYELSRFDFALIELDKIQPDEPEYGRSRLLKALISMFHRRQFFSALQIFEQLEPNEEFAQIAWYLDGLLHQFHLKDLERAEICFRKAAELSGNDESGNQLKFQSLFRLSQILEEKDPVKNSEEILSLLPLLDQSRDPFYREFAALGRKRFSEAGPSRLLQNGIRQYMHNDWEGALAIYRNLIAEHPESPEAGAALLRCSDIEGVKFQRYEIALADLSDYLERNASYPDLALYKMARINELYLLEYQKAVELYYRITNEFSESIWYEEAVVSLSNILIQIYSDYDEAENLLRNALTGMAETAVKARIRFQLALLLEESRKDFPAAREVYQELITRNVISDYFTEAYRRYLNLSNREAISKGDTRLRESKEGHRETMMQMAAAHDSLGESDKALEYFEKAYFMQDFVNEKDLGVKIRELYRKSENLTGLVRFLRQNIVKLEQRKTADDFKTLSGELRWEILSVYRDELRDYKNVGVLLGEIKKNTDTAKRVSFNQALMALAEGKPVDLSGSSGYDPDTVELSFASYALHRYTLKELEALKPKLSSPSLRLLTDEEISQLEQAESLEKSGSASPESFLKLADFYAKRGEPRRQAESLRTYANRCSVEQRPVYLEKAAAAFIESHDTSEALSALSNILQNHYEYENYLAVYRIYAGLTLSGDDPASLDEFTAGLARMNEGAKVP
ncbi:MAG: tetratricopeptide repeat protein, partial [Candidatus Wallbacteria bacterium]|nr:tetratricopeptide repeat protein [Candidatus Wallbacteria bacterium]